MVENSAAPKRLFRSQKERMVAGVAGGLAQYFNVDLVLVRLALVALVLVPGLGGIVLIGYVAAAIIVPKRPAGEAEPAITGSSVGIGDGRQVLAYILVAIGVLILAGNLGWYALIQWHLVWPLVLIAIGALLLIRQRD
ncbi:MAG: PspC domain-containing protein [Chloroflexota bacterium]